VRTLVAFVILLLCSLPAGAQVSTVPLGPNGGSASGGGAPTGAAGGSLTGTYPNPGLNLGGTNTGILPAVNGGTGEAGTITGALKGNGTSAATQAACADLSNATAGCSAAAGQLPGTATNDSASAGNVGQLVSSHVVSGSAVALTTSTPANITSISLTAGNWEVSGICAEQPNGATTSTALICTVSTASATLNTTPSDSAGWALNQTALTAGSAMSLPTSTARLSLASTTTVFLVVQSTFAVNTMGAYGSLRATRPR
jgi:hypothetical protein